MGASTSSSLSDANGISTASSAGTPGLLVADTDNDGLCDGGLAVFDNVLSVLICAAGEDLNGNGLLDPGETDPNDDDTDCDAVPDGEERTLQIDPTDVVTDFSRGSPAPSDHGTAVAEVIYDFAPGATYYLATISTQLEMVEVL